MLRIDFMDMSTGKVYAQASGVRVQNGKLVPDNLGLPPLESPCIGCPGSVPADCDDCPWKGVE